MLQFTHKTALYYDSKLCTIKNSCEVQYFQDLSTYK